MVPDLETSKLRNMGEQTWTLFKVFGCHLHDHEEGSLVLEANLLNLQLYLGHAKVVMKDMVGALGLQLDSPTTFATASSS